MVEDADGRWTRGRLPCSRGFLDVEVQEKSNKTANIVVFYVAIPQETFLSTILRVQGSSPKEVLRASPSVGHGEVLLTKIFEVSL